MLKFARGRPRLLAGLVTGVVAWLAMLGPWGATLPAIIRAVLAWDIGVAVFLSLAMHMFLSERLDHMEQDAVRQQEGEWVVFAITLFGATLSFAAVISVFAALKANPDLQGLRVGLVGATLFESWLMTHATFALRYAHEFYSRDSSPLQIDGGLEFPATERPDYFDFVYFSLVLGMTFQVSDVQITSRKLRRLATLQGLVSFLFNTIIVALSVNLAAGLL
jgi:uncharacterized membrane protein